MKVKLIEVSGIRRWPRLLGRICTIEKRVVGEPAVLSFSDGTMRTAVVEKIVTAGDEIHLHTNNAVYKFEKS
ncbi:MAG: hypothetical protein ACLTXM_16215 [Enterococcus sp.]